MKIVRKLAIIIASLAMVLLMGAPAQAATPDLTSLQNRALAGTLTTYDRSYLKGHPEIARILVDGKATRYGVVNYNDAQAKARMSPSELATLTATTYCSATDRYQIWSSLTGATIFRYHTYAHWCWTGTNVRVDTHYPYLDMIDWVVVNKGITVNELRNGNPIWTIHNQNYIQLCTLGKSLGSICYSNLYPTNWVTVSNKPGSTFKHSMN